MTGVCSVCGQNRGKCQPVRDAGNFLIPVCRVWEDAGGIMVEGLTHEIDAATPIKVTFNAILPENGCRIKLIESETEIK